VKRIKVNLNIRSYPIIIGENSINKLVGEINSLAVSKCLFIIDHNVEKFHSKYLRNIFTNLNCKFFKYILTATERNKNLYQANKIFNFLSINYFDRSSVIISIGGGITGDISGFVASTFMRGIKYYQIPTTLLSMVDSSVGGKTGVNFEKRKNLIGTFYQPNSVYINKLFLESLPKNEVISGAGEILKYAFLADIKNYGLLINNLKKIIQGEDFNFEKTIQNCLTIKTNIVSQDEKEITGLRKILNFGHTFAHAFETQSNYKLKHGEAVIAGIFCALFLSENTGYISHKKLNGFLNDFNFFKVNKSLSKLNSELIYKSMLTDKKNLSGKIKLVLIEDIGNIIVDATSEKSAILKSISRMKALI
jgi:3-dehydroquinate synthase